MMYSGTISLGNGFLVNISFSFPKLALASSNIKQLPAIGYPRTLLIPLVVVVNDLFQNK